MSIITLHYQTVMNRAFVTTASGRASLIDLELNFLTPRHAAKYTLSYQYLTPWLWHAAVACRIPGVNYVYDSPNCATGSQEKHTV